MKRAILCILMLVLTLGLLTMLSCKKKEEEKKIADVFINESGELVFSYLDGSTENLGVVVGADGAVGPAGADGKDGTNGVDGKGGIDGVNGTNGMDGKDGVDGIDGKDGANGKDGVDGKDGKDGKDGINGADGKDGQTIVIETDSALRAGATKAIKSIVSITAGKSRGTGVIFQMNKAAGELYILTNYHVIYDKTASENENISKEIYAYLYGQELDGYKIPLSFFGGSKTYDIAVLRASDSEIVKSSICTAAEIADSDLVSVADDVIAIGNAYGMGISVTTGIVSVDSENVTLSTCEGEVVDCRVIRTDAAINPGNSGGGLYNAAGELVGIVCGAPNMERVDGIGYAIPSNVAIALAQNILYNAYKYFDASCPQIVDLGIEKLAIRDVKCTFDSENQKIQITEEIVIEEIAEGSLAAGVLEEGDILRSVRIGDEGELVTLDRSHKLHDFLLGVRLGDSITITYVRDGIESDVTIPLDDASYFESCV